MLIGNSYHTMDQKNRITIPVKHREELGAVCMLVQGSLGNLMLYPVAKWEEMIRDIDNYPKEEQNELRDFAFSISAQVTPDSQGRIVIPADHVEYAKIVSDVVISGNGEYEAIWASEVWEEYRARTEQIKREKLRKIGF